MKEHVKKNRDRILIEISSSIRKVVSEYTDLEKMKKKEPLMYLYISFLRSSIVNCLPFIRIDAYDHKGYGDITPCFDYPNLDFLQDKVYESMPSNINLDTLQGQTLILGVEEQWERDFGVVWDEVYILLNEYRNKVFPEEISRGIALYFGEYFGAVRRL